MSERGSATLPAVALLAVLLAVTSALAWVGGLVVAHRRAQAAADLGALAGAMRGGSCGAARQVVERNGAELERCVASAGQVWVTVTVAAPGLAGQAPRVQGQARAGPAP